MNNTLANRKKTRRRQQALTEMSLSRRPGPLKYRCVSSSNPPRRNQSRSSGLTNLPSTNPRGRELLREKQRSKYNALKHGIYSKAPLFKDESLADYNSLLLQLVEYHQPEGSTEELLVENLAILTLRRRRFLKAEVAEIAKGTEFLGADDLRRLKFEAQDRENILGGMLHQCTNPIVLQDAIELLNQLRGNFEEGGLGIEKDLCILRKLYGPFSTENPPRGLPHAYLTFGTVASHSPGEERRRIPSYSN